MYAIDIYMCVWFVELFLVNFSLKDFTSYISEVGWPYLWAQWLGGLQFLENNAVNTPDENVSFAHMQETIRRLKHRVRSRLCLMKQTAAFGVLVVV